MAFEVISLPMTFKMGPCCGDSLLFRETLTSHLNLRPWLKQLKLGLEVNGGKLVEGELSGTQWHMTLI